MSHHEALRIVAEVFDPVFIRLGLRRIGFDYNEISFGNITATYESSRLRLRVIRDRSIWEVRVGADEEPLELILQFLGQPYLAESQDLPRNVESNFEKLAELFSPANYSTFRKEFDDFTRARSLRRQNIGSVFEETPKVRPPAD